METNEQPWTKRVKERLEEYSSETPENEWNSLEEKLKAEDEAGDKQSVMACESGGERKKLKLFSAKLLHNQKKAVPLHRF
jgi:hypothetical protein